MSGFLRLKRFLFRYSLVPPRRWRLKATILMGCIAGLGVYSLKLGNATSYLSDNPKACINCHIMTPQYLTWNHSSHREVAHCNDCHVPHNNIFNKYYFKAKDGLYHSAVFTLGAEPEVIRAREPSVKVIQNNCIRCHKDQVTDARMEGFVEGHCEKRTDRLCWDCHKEVPHGKVRSLSAVGHQIENLGNPDDEPYQNVPSWLEEANGDEPTKD